MKKPIAPIPEPPRDASPALKAMLSALKEALEVRLGRRGDPLEEAITKRELVESGIAKIRSQAAKSLEPVTQTPAEANIIPPAPVGLTAIGMFGGVQLSWESPFEAYNVHAYAEIWRGESNDPTKRVLINSSRGGIFFDRILDDIDTPFWYWVRFVSEYDKYGPFSGPVKAAKEPNVELILEEISGKIDESVLSDAFRADYTGVKDALAQHDQTLSIQGAQIQQQMAITRQQGDTIHGLSAQYTLRLNVNGHIAGFGVYNSGTTSDFAIVADRFWIARPGSNDKTKPFVVQNNRVYIDTALIREASIEQGKLGPITFGKLVDSRGRSVTTVNGKLLVEHIDVTSLRVTDANISGVLRSNAVGRNGQPRWMLDKNGGFTMNGAGTGGRLEMRDDVLKVFDGNSRLRVQIGNLQA